jgi:hypothetical protein
MVSTNSSWQLLREQLMQIEDTMIPSAPLQKNPKAMGNIIHDNHWIEFDIDVLIGEKGDNKLGCFIHINELNHSIVVTNILNHDGLIHPYDRILSFNDMNFTNLTKETAQCVINAHQGKLVNIHIRRLQPTILETIEFNFLNSRKFGFTIDGGIGRADDPGLFIIGIKSNGRAAKNGRLRIGDRLMQISNTHTTVNLQCIEFKVALKLIKRMRKESNSVSFVVAHQTQN